MQVFTELVEGASEMVEERFRREIGSGLGIGTGSGIGRTFQLLVTVKRKYGVTEWLRTVFGADVVIIIIIIIRSGCQLLGLVIPEFSFLPERPLD